MKRLRKRTPSPRFSLPGEGEKAGGRRGFEERRANGSAPDRQAGFSLIELMVVVVLIGIMTAMVLPAMKGSYEDALLRSTGRHLVDALNLANSKAVTIGQLHRVRIDRNRGRYVVEREVHNAQRGNGFVAIGDVPGSEGELDKRIKVEVRKLPASSAMGGEPEAPLILPEVFQENDRDAIVFYADGTAEAGDIMMRDRDGFRLALRINPTTARTSIVELGRE